jgi:glycosyltransferase involved in cell wall biosynthesis
MAKRFRIGLSFFFNDQTNSGIVNYIYNIIAALKTLPEGEKPKIIVFHNDQSPIVALKEINYPYISFFNFRDHPSGKLANRFNHLAKRIFKVNFFAKLKYYNKIDCLYPYFDFLDFGMSDAKNKIRWLVDFNNRAFPQHYKDNGKSASEFQSSITARPDVKIVLSSNSLFGELKQYHPNYQCEVKVMPFACTIPELTIDVNDLLEKFQIDGKFMISPNQFWEHKNQAIILDALRLIKREYPALKFKIIFTGSLEVNRGKMAYSDIIKQKIEEYGLEDSVSMLGVLDRKEQLTLMKHAVAIIQPSLYEGWSTLVEEAKALNQFIILSDLPVHREQIAKNAIFFNPKDAEELSRIIIQRLADPMSALSFDYSLNVKKFAQNIINAFR